jgi:hypothetical protein
MRAKKVMYERLVNTGNYSHEKYGIEIEIEKGDSVNNAFVSAKKVVDHQLRWKRQAENSI